MAGIISTMAYPVQAVQDIAGAAGVDPRPIQRATLFQGANEGPATTAAKISGVVSGGMRTDNAPYHTNNDGIPWPAPDRSKTIGGLPLASDIFLFQKQQEFNRHKLLERMVHPCGSGAFGHFETTLDMSHLTKADSSKVPEQKHQSSFVTRLLHLEESSPTWPRIHVVLQSSSILEKVNTI